MNLKKYLYLALAGTLLIKTFGAGFNQQETIAHLKKNLEARDAKKKAHAAIALQYYGVDDSLDDIRKLLKDKSKVVVKAAVTSLARFKDEASLDDMYKLFRKARKKKGVQSAILEYFRQVNDTDTEEFLLKYMVKLDPELSAQAYQVLKQIQEPKSFEEDSGRSSIESFTISGFIGRGKKAKVKIDREFFAVGDSILDFKITAIDTSSGLVSLADSKGNVHSKEIDDSGGDPLEKAIVKLNSEEDKEVYKALLEINYFQDSKPSAELLGLASGKNSVDIRVGAISAIGNCAVENADETLHKIIGKEKKTDLLIASALSLALLENENSLDHLTPLAQHANPWVRNAAIYSIGYFGADHTIATLVGALNDKYSFVRNNAMNQLMELAASGYKASIVAILQNYSKKMNHAKRTLGKYLATIEGGDGSFDPFATGTRTKTKKKKAYKPKFALVSIGSFGAKTIVTVIEKDEKKNLTVGEFVEGLEITKIDLDEEIIEIRLKNGKTAVIMQGEDSESPAELLEVK